MNFGRVLTFVGCLFCTIGFSQLQGEKVFPENEAFLTDTVIDFVWNYSDTAVSYDIEVGNDPGFVSVFFSQNTTATSSEVNSFITGNRYYWRVRPQFSTGAGQWSVIDTFTVFVPSDILGLQLWLSSDSGVVESAGSVSQWSDRSIGLNHAAQAAGGRQPTYIGSVAAINDHPALGFDGGDVLSITTNMNAYSNVAGITAFTVYKSANNGGAVERPLFISTNSAAPTRFSFTDNDPSAGSSRAVIRMDDGVSATNVDGGSMTSEYHIRTALADYSTNTYTTYRNTQEVTSASGSSSGLTSNTTSAAFYVGAYDANGGSGLEGDYAELIMYNEALTDSAKELVEGYLRYKYAPPVNLGPDTVMEGFCSYTLDAGDRFVSYVWSDGSTSSTLSVTETGEYSITVTDIFGFASEDAIKVSYPGNFLGGDSVLCVEDSLVWDVGLSKSDYSYLWSTGSIDSLIVVHTGGDYSVTVTDGSSCNKVSDTLSIVLDQYPITASLNSDTTMCAGNSIGLANGAPQTISYLWSTSETTTTISIDSTYNYHVSVTNVNGCFARDTVLVTILGEAPEIQVLIDGQCSGDLITFSDLSTVSNDVITSRVWNSSVGLSSTDSTTAFTYTMGTLDTINITVTASSGCFAVHQVVDTIYQSPNVFFETYTACVGSDYLFFDATSIPDNDSITNWFWTFGDGFNAALADPLHEYQQTGTFPVDLNVTTTQGCEGYYEDSLVVNVSTTLPSCLSLVEPVSGIFFDSSQDTISLCWNQGNNIMYYRLQLFSDEALGSAILDTNYILENNYIYDNTSFGADRFYWRVIGYNSCGDSIISETNTGTYFVPSDILGLQLWLSSDSGVVESAGSVSQWSDRSIGLNHAAQAAGGRQPTYIGSVAAINDHPALGFDGGDVLSITTNMNAYSNVAGITAFTVYKSANNGGAVERPLFISTDNGAATRFSFTDNDPSAGSSRAVIRMDDGVSATNVDGGSMTSEYHIRTALADYSTNTYTTYRNTQEVTSASGSSSGLTSNTTSAAFYVGAYDANGGSGLEGEYAELIMYNEALTDSAKELVEGYLRYKYAPPVNLGPDTVMEGFCSYTLDAGDRFVSYVWSDGSTSSTLSVTETGEYSVTVTDIFGFASEDVIKVSYPGNFLGGDSVLCVEDSLVWDVGLSKSDYSYLWSTGSTDSLIVVHTGGDYSVTVTDGSSCSKVSDTLTVMLDLYRYTASLGNDTIICSGNMIGLQNGAQETQIYLWNSGESTSELAINLSGTYHVSVTNVNGCFARDTVDVVVQGDAPTAFFTFNNTCIYDSTYFTDQSVSNDLSNIVQWQWNLGDGSISSNVSPVHFYGQDSTFVASLTVTTDSGCAQFYNDTIRVYSRPVAQVSISSTLPCSGEEVSFNMVSVTENLTVTWNFGDGNSVTPVLSLDTTYLYQQGADYLVYAAFVNENGCVDTINVTTEITQSPIAQFVYQPTCENEMMQFLDQTENANNGWTWQWGFGDGQTQQGDEPNPTHTYAIASSYLVTMSIVDASGCNSSVTQNVTVSANPVADFTVTDFCLHTPIQVFDESTSNDSVVKWEWDVINHTNSSNKRDPIFNFIYNTPSSYNLHLEVTTDVGCIGETTKVITIHDQPTADFTFDPEFGGPPLEVNFTNQSIDGNTYLWSFGNGESSTDENPTVTYATEDRFDMQLITYSDFGCADTTSDFIKVIVPSLDMAVSNISSNTISNDQFLQITAELVNLGTREVNDFNLIARTSDGSTIMEQWSGQLYTLDGITYVFTGAFELPDGELPNTVCVLLSEPNGEEDDNPLNNEACLSLNEFIVFDPYPNPAQDVINIDFVLPNNGEVVIEMYNAIGKHVRTLYSGEATQGLNKLQYPIYGLSAELYTFSVLYEEQVVLKKFIRITQE